MSWSLVSEPDLSEQEFTRWKTLLEERIGIRLAAHQKKFLQNQVSKRMRELGETDFDRYFQRVDKTAEGQLEWSILVDRLVVKETSFFRHEPSLNFVCQHLQDRINNDTLDESYDVWSLGCSTGEEAYSLGMLINESFELAKREAYFGITATDVSKVAVSLARTGQYSARKLEFVPSAFRYKYFSEYNTGQFRFDHEISSRLCFISANVLRVKEMPKLQFDVIYCQNMLVYFQQVMRRKLLDAIAEKLKPGGVLVIGLGEVTNWKHPKVERVARADVQTYVALNDSLNL